MSDEVEKTPEVQVETPASSPKGNPVPAEAKPEPAPGPEPIVPKEVSFKDDSLTFDEAQQEINSIKERAGAARDSLRSGPTTYSSSSFTSSYHSSDDTPKSKNMLSHLNSESAMLNYKVQTARSLVRKQEDLLRNLTRMRENMERSEVELGKASDYYARSTVSSRPRYQTSRSYSVPRRAPSPLKLDVSDVLDQLSDAGSSSHRSPVVPRSQPSVDVPTYQPRQTPVPRDYGVDEDFEREMALLRKRVTDLTRQASETTASKGRDYGYYEPSSAYLKGYGGAVATEVTCPLPRITSISTPFTSTLYSSYVPELSYSRRPTTSFSEYVLSALDEYPPAIHIPSPQRDCSPNYTGNSSLPLYEGYQLVL